MSCASSATEIPSVNAIVEGSVMNFPIRRIILIATRRLIVRRPSFSAILTRIGKIMRMMADPAPATSVPAPGAIAITG